MLTSFVEFTTASTSRFQGFPLHKYIFELTSLSTGNFDTDSLPSPLSAPKGNARGSGKCEPENEVSSPKDWSASFHRGTWSNATKESPLSVGNPPLGVAEVATGEYIAGTTVYNTNPSAELSQSLSYINNIQNSAVMNNLIWYNPQLLISNQKYDQEILFATLSPTPSFISNIKPQKTYSRLNFKDYPNPESSPRRFLKL